MSWHWRIIVLNCSSFTRFSSNWLYAKTEPTFCMKLVWIQRHNRKIFSMKMNVEYALIMKILMHVTSEWEEKFRKPGSEPMLKCMCGLQTFHDTWFISTICVWYEHLSVPSSLLSDSRTQDKLIIFFPS